jgi:hypothetical protein
MVNCLKCGADLSSEKRGGCVASISGSIMGDEHTESYFLCGKCGVYTVELYYEPFLNEEQVSFRGPVGQAEGDAAVALIKKCLEPWDKKCRCEAHQSYFNGQLD